MHKNSLFTQIWKTSAGQNNYEAFEAARNTGAPQFAALIESLILHPTTYLPTNSFVEFLFLERLFGLRPMQRLIEADRLKFVFVPHVIGYIGGTGDVAEITLMDQEGQQPRPTWKEVEPAAELMAQNFSNPTLGKEVSKLLVRHSKLVDMKDELDNLYKISKSEFRDALNSTGKPIQENFRFKVPNDNIRIFLGGMSPFRNPKKATSLELVDHYLAFVYANLELKLADKIGLSDVSSSALSRVQSDVKYKKLKQTMTKDSEIYYELRKLSRIPDLGGEVTSGRLSLDSVVDLILKSDCVNFQDWFHQNSASEGDVSRAYVDLVKKHNFGRIDGKKTIKFMFFQAMGLIPGVGMAASAIDEFVLPRLGNGFGTRLFMERMTKGKWSTPAYRKPVFETKI